MKILKKERPWALDVPSDRREAMSPESLGLPHTWRMLRVAQADPYPSTVPRTICSPRLPPRLLKWGQGHGQGQRLGPVCREMKLQVHRWIADRCSGDR